MKKFPCCADPVGDLKASLKYWDEVHRCVTAIAEPLGALEFKSCMDTANDTLREQCRNFGIV
jgi:hypothetical protein